MVKKLYKNGFKRALTFSFDDGTAQDMRLVDILNKYSLKATFNLMGGKCNNGCFRIAEGDYVTWDGSKELKNIYKGHEIASHTYTHPHLPELTTEEIDFQIGEDVKALSLAFDTPIYGFVAPFGKFDERVTETVKKYGLKYCRSTEKCYDFSLPEDFYSWKPAPHFAYYSTEEGKQMIKDFFACENEMPLFDIWGHSFELNLYNEKEDEKFSGIRDRFTYFDNLCKTLSGNDDTWYATNIEIYDYVTAMRKAKVSDTYIDNPTDTELYFNVNGTLIIAPPRSRFGF